MYLANIIERNASGAEVLLDSILTELVPAIVEFESSGNYRQEVGLTEGATVLNVENESGIT